jgi:4-diphosphocytidyl-2-C-methyl-D-erythritol kinase
MIRLSPAKINLGLLVIEKRTDGYHNLQTLFYPIDWSDIVEVVPSNKLQLYVTGLNPCINMEDNICAKAFRMLQHDFNLYGADIYLHKHVPFGAGLGGGSSNATSVLLAANAAFNLHLSLEQIQEYAARLGSDCAFFIHCKPMLAYGRGEILHPSDISLKGRSLLIVKPNININTTQAYKNITPRKNRMPLHDIIAMPMSKWQAWLTNDFEESAFMQYPILRHIKDSMYLHGAIYAAMSGSGSAIYGIFDAIPQALTAEFSHYITFSQSA